MKYTKDDFRLLSLDRMTNALLSYDEILFMNEVQTFWRNQWELQDIPDPEDPDPLNYALKACIAERIVEIWSSPPKNKNISVPSWCNSVKPFGEGWSVIPSSYRFFFEGSPVSPVFAKRNIFAPQDFMFFV